MSYPPIEFLSLQTWRALDWLLASLRAQKSKEDDPVKRQELFDLELSCIDARLLKYKTEGKDPDTQISGQTGH